MFISYPIDCRICRSIAGESHVDQHASLFTHNVCGFNLNQESDQCINKWWTTKEYRKGSGHQFIVQIVSTILGWLFVWRKHICWEYYQTIYRRMGKNDFIKNTLFYIHFIYQNNRSAAHTDVSARLTNQSRETFKR